MPAKLTFKVIHNECSVAIQQSIKLEQFYKVTIMKKKILVQKLQLILVSIQYHESNTTSPCTI